MIEIGLYDPGREYDFFPSFLKNITSAFCQIQDFMLRHMLNKIRIKLRPSGPRFLNISG